MRLILDSRNRIQWVGGESTIHAPAGGGWTICGAWFANQKTGPVTCPKCKEVS